MLLLFKIIYLIKMFLNALKLQFKFFFFFNWDKCFCINKSNINPRDVSREMHLYADYMFRMFQIILHVVYIYSVRDFYPFCDAFDCHCRPSEITEFLQIRNIITAQKIFPEGIVFSCVWFFFLFFFECLRVLYRTA